MRISLILWNNTSKKSSIQSSNSCGTLLNSRSIQIICEDSDVCGKYEYVTVVERIQKRGESFAGRMV